MRAAAAALFYHHRDRMENKPLLFSKHAQDMIDERKIPLDWIERV
jgi:hypothetical protein